MRAPAAAPCRFCPYRRDVPSGVWMEDEYAKLPPYDGKTWEQPVGVFLCHQQDGRACAGWASVHGDENSMALRMASAAGYLDGETLDAILDYEASVPVFATGAEAAEHGLAEVETPGPAALRTVERLQRKRRRGGRLPAMDENIVTDEEIRTLSDAKLVALIEERSNLRGDAAREALTIIRDEIPDDVDF